jgi:hypothetical protein
VAATHGRDWPWALALVLLASVAGETIASHNTPPVAYVRSPLTLPFLVISYGCWALLLREAWARGYLSWAGGIVAGIGYTAFNEGLVAQTWFRPGLNGFSDFRLGRLAGVNWCIVIGLCVFHTVFSMAMPIAAVQLRRGERAPRPWLRRRGMVIAGASIVLVILGMVLGDPAARRPRWTRPIRLAPGRLRLRAGLGGCLLPRLLRAAGGHRVSRDPRRGAGRRHRRGVPALLAGPATVGSRALGSPDRRGAHARPGM